MFSYPFKVINGDFFSLQFSPDSPISIVRNNVAQKINKDPKEVALIYRATNLTDNFFLNQLPMFPGDTIYIQTVNHVARQLPQYNNLPNPPKSKADDPIRLFKRKHPDWKDLVEQLLDMGFQPEEKCLISLLEAKGNLEKATIYLLNDEIPNKVRKKQKDSIHKEDQIDFINFGLSQYPECFEMVARMLEKKNKERVVIARTLPESFLRSHGLDPDNFDLEEIKKNGKYSPYKKEGDEDENGIGLFSALLNQMIDV